MKPTSEHEQHYFHDTATRMHRVVCTRCGAESGWLGTRQLTEDWFFKHLDEIERIKANLGSRNPSLKQQAAYYRERAEDTSLPREQRDLWDILATGLERRLGLSQAQEQEMLFQMP